MSRNTSNDSTSVVITGLGAISCLGVGPDALWQGLLSTAEQLSWRQVALIFFILPGIYLAVRWYFVPQAVVVDGRRSTGALERSAELVRGQWWRVFGVVILTILAAGIPATVIEVPFRVAASSADSSAVDLIGQIVAAAITAPFEALMLTLLYFDLLARRNLPAMVPPVQPPP